jgi:hypothetical protein
MKISQSGVSEDFLMIVPVYLELEDGRVSQIAHAVMKGSHDLDKSFSVGKLPGTPKRLVANYNYDILSAN